MGHCKRNLTPPVLFIHPGLAWFARGGSGPSPAFFARRCRRKPEPRTWLSLLTPSCVPVPRRRARSSPRASCTAVHGTNGRNLPSPLASPPFPGSEWDGAPIIGVSGEAPDYPLYKALGLAKRKSRFKVYGWASIGGDLSTSHDPAAVLVSTRGGSSTPWTTRWDLITAPCPA